MTAIKTCQAFKVLGFSALLFLSACAPSSSHYASNSVDAALTSPGMFKVPPYTRSIISSHNF